MSEAKTPRNVDEIRDRQTLQAFVAKGGRAKYVFFWGHQPEKDGSIGKGCLSQWWSAPFEVDGARYSSAEHYMMAEKARLFADQTTRERILAAASPGSVKALGRLVQGFVEDRWVHARFDIVVAGNVAKFGQNEDLRRFLLATRKRVLVEASPKDRIWGIGMGVDNEKATNPELWRGQNLLGFALMAAREILSATE
jgi:ribA/ribD-fused uncharacterized protein